MLIIVFLFFFFIAIASNLLSRHDLDLDDPCLVSLVHITALIFLLAIVGDLHGFGLG
jgi:hypothetical protein